MFIFAYPIYLQLMRVKFVYEGLWVKVKFTRAEVVQNPYSSNVKH